MADKVILKKVYLIRHGESLHNRKPIFQANDARLSQTGLAQAELIASRLRDTRLDSLISSPFLRAQQTSAIISRAVNLPIVFSDLFVECLMPQSISGKAYQDKTAYAAWRQWQKRLYSQKDIKGDGESYNQLLDRTEKALNYLQTLSGQNIAVVTHGFFLRTIIARVILGETIKPKLLQKFQEQMQTHNTGVTILTMSKDLQNQISWNLTAFNDHSHLR